MSETKNGETKKEFKNFEEEVLDYLAHRTPDDYDLPIDTNPQASVFIHTAYVS